MSEKHLTELPWKTLAGKHKLKDPGIAKALAEFGKCAEEDYEARLKALDAVEKHAGAMEKENKKNKEVADYLGEVLREADRGRKAVELLKKSKDKGAVKEEAGEDEEGGDLKSKLLGGMKKVKGHPPDAPLMEAMVCKAGRGFGVLLAKKVGSGQKKQLLEIFKNESGQKFFSGTCEWGEGEIYTFILDTIPTGAAKGLKAFFREHTNNNYKIRVGDASGTMEDDLEEAVAGAPPVAPPAAPPQPGDPMALFTQRFKALLPKIKEAIAAAGPNAPEIKLKAGEAGASAQKKDYTRANELLDQTEMLLKSQGSRIPPEAGKQAEPKKGFSLVDLQKGRLGWDGLRKTVQTQLQGLEKEILAGVRAHNEDETAEDQFDEGKVGAAIKTLYTILDKLDTRLIDKLDEALNAKTEEERRSRHHEAGKIVKEYQDFAASDPTLATVDENGFAQTSIRSAVATTLADLAAKF